MTEDEMYDIISGYEASEREYHEHNIKLRFENATLKKQITILREENIKLNTKLQAPSRNKIETFEEDFYWSVAWYNGYDDEFDKVLNYLKEQQKIIDENEAYLSEIVRPDFITTDNSMMELYWMLLVQDFGDYGTSPRSGWIYRDELDDCINHITEMINKTYGEGR